MRDVAASGGRTTASATRMSLSGCVYKRWDWARCSRSSSSSWPALSFTRCSGRATREGREIH